MIAPWELAPWDLVEPSQPQPRGESLFSSIEQENGLPSGLLDSVWSAESARGKNMGPSRAGAQGHFQFMPGTAKRYGLEDPSDLEQSAIAAGRYLGDLMELHHGDVRKAVASYNWGEGNVLRKGMERMPTETRGYVTKVLGGLPQSRSGAEIRAPWEQVNAAS